MAGRRGRRLFPFPGLPVSCVSPPHLRAFLDLLLPSDLTPHGRALRRVLPRRCSGFWVDPSSLQTGSSSRGGFLSYCTGGFLPCLFFCFWNSYQSDTRTQETLRILSTRNTRKDPSRHIVIPKPLKTRETGGLTLPDGKTYHKATAIERRGAGTGQARTPAEQDRVQKETRTFLQPAGFPRERQGRSAGERASLHPTDSHMQKD